MSSKINKLMKLPIKSKIDKIVASDFAACLTNSG
jgi:hypothetical protein